MSVLEKNESDKVFLSIVQGTLRQSVPEGTSGAVVREWEVGGKRGVKHEMVFSAVRGRIVGVDIYEGESGNRKFQNVNITLDSEDSDKFPVISVGTGTRYGQDILKKLPNVNFLEQVRIRPYSFVPDGEDKPVTGVELTQQDGTGNFNKKITSFFHKKVNDKWEAQNGFPTPEGDIKDYQTDDWDIFYKKTRRFLVDYTKERIVPKFAQAYTPKTKEEQDRLEDNSADSQKDSQNNSLESEFEDEITDDDISF